MESIFHEKQEGSLCAQHCLNALLQGPFFTPVDLATLAQRMDDEERLRMAELGEDTEEYQRFIEQPSGNMDDSGYFSVQVISSALEVWGLELVPFNSSDVLSREANAHPEKMSAYICNYRDHWFTIRKLGYQWFNLNSLRTKPELISETYLGILLAQLQQEGYSIFIVKGRLPECPADELLKITPAEPIKKAVKKDAPKSPQDLELEKAIKLSLGEPEDKEDVDLQEAIRMSLAEEKDDPSLNRALELSLQAASPPPQGDAGPSKSELPTQQIRPSAKLDGEGDIEEDEELQGAIRLSLQGLEPSTEGQSEQVARQGESSPQPPASGVQHSPQASRGHQPRVVNIPIHVEGRDSVSSRLPTSRGKGSITLASNSEIEEIRRKRLAYLDKLPGPSKE